MMINKKKSGIMFFRKRKQNKNSREKELAGYPIVEEYKYLGI